MYASQRHFLWSCASCASAAFEKSSSGEKKGHFQLPPGLTPPGCRACRRAGKGNSRAFVCAAARGAASGRSRRGSQTLLDWSGMPGAKCRVKHLSKEMPGARRRMEEHGGLPPLPDRGSHGRPESPWSRSPNTCGSDRSSTPPPIDPYARSSPVPTPVEEPVAAPTKGEPTGWDKNSGGHKARELGARMNTLRRQETKKLMDGAVSVSYTHLRAH